MSSPVKKERAMTMMSPLTALSHSLERKARIERGRRRHSRKRKSPRTVNSLHKSIAKEQLEKTLHDEENVDNYSMPVSLVAETGVLASANVISPVPISQESGKTRGRKGEMDMEGSMSGVRSESLNTSFESEEFDFASLFAKGELSDSSGSLSSLASGSMSSLTNSRSNSRSGSIYSNFDSGFAEEDSSSEEMVGSKIVKLVNKKREEGRRIPLRDLGRSYVDSAPSSISSSPVGSWKARNAKKNRNSGPKRLSRRAMSFSVDNFRPIKLDPMELLKASVVEQKNRELDVIPMEEEGSSEEKYGILGEDSFEKEEGFELDEKKTNESNNNDYSNNNNNNNNNNNKTNYTLVRKKSIVEELVTANRFSRSQSLCNMAQLPVLNRARSFSPTFMPSGAGTGLVMPDASSWLDSPSSCADGVFRKGLTLRVLDKAKHDCFNCITPNTLAEVMDGKHKHFDRVVILDCRFDFEYEGGHIRDAIHIGGRDPNILSKKFFKNKLPGKTCVVFHCEFSSRRGPEKWRFMRELDRKKNQNNYPELWYTEMYLLEGGYCKFFQTHKHYCEPRSYVEMNDARFTECLKGNFKKQNSFKTLLRKSGSINGFHTAPSMLP